MSQNAHDVSFGSQGQGAPVRDNRNPSSRQIPMNEEKTLSEEENLEWEESQRLRSARLLTRDAFHEICGACQRIRDNNSFSHHDYQDLIKSALSGCNTCRVILDGVQGSMRGATVANPALHVEVDRYNERFRVRAEGTSRSVSFDLFVSSFGDEDHLLRKPNGSDNWTEKENREVREITVADEPFFFPTLYRRIPLEVDSMRSYQQIHRWMNNCFRNHPRCIENTKRTGGVSRAYPTRLLEIDKDKVRLRHNQQNVLVSRPSYAALSYCWGGVGDTLRTTVATLASHTSGIARDRLPRTIQDAASVCLRLSIKFLWVDALCVLQDSPEDCDWAAECARMGDYYSSATLTISALESLSVDSGFLGRRPEVPSARLLRSVWDPQGYGGHPEIWIRQSPEPHGMVMLKAPLSRRGWVLQERVLSTRIVHFAQSGLLWECLTCSVSEGSTEIYEHKQDCSNITHSGGSDFKRALFTPNESDHYSIVDGAFAIWQRFVVEYSARQLTYPADRIPAIAGLAAVIGEKTGSPYCSGIFVHDLAELAWRRHSSWVKVPEESQPDPAPVPSWSWAQPNWRVVFPFYDEERTASPLDAQFVGYDQTVKHGCLTLRARLCRLSDNSGLAKIRIAQRVNRTKMHMVTGPHRLPGCTCNTEVEETRVYYLHIMPDDIEPGCWKRISSPSHRHVVGCTGKQPNDDFKHAKWETVRLV